MADDDENPLPKVIYTDVAEPEETNWIKRAGTCEITYPNGCTFAGTYDSERVKQGQGKYVWMGPASEDDPETLVEKARYEGNYVDGQKSGVGKMVYPNGDVYEGEWVANKMEGQGTYTYKKTGDIYSGTFQGNKKHGAGDYEFGKDNSRMTGTWENGEIVSGKWIFKGAAEYEGTFKMGKPINAGKFTFASGLSQEGSFEVVKAEGEEEPAEDEAPVAPITKWAGKSIVSF